MDKLVNEVTKRGKPSAMAIKRFEQEIRRIQLAKEAEVVKKYPSESIIPRDIIINGGGKLRTAAELRLCIKKDSDGYRNSISFDQIFDVEKEIEIIKRRNEEVQEIRNRLALKIETDVRQLINCIYFGETNLVETLKEFEEKRYI